MYVEQYIALDVRLATDSTIYARYIRQCTVYEHCTVYNVHCTSYDVNCTVRSVDVRFATVHAYCVPCPL